MKLEERTLGHPVYVRILLLKPTLRNLESPRALHSAVVMFQNNGGRKETLSEKEDGRELFNGYKKKYSRKRKLNEKIHARQLILKIYSCYGLKKIPEVREYT